MREHFKSVIALQCKADDVNWLFSEIYSKNCKINGSPEKWILNFQFHSNRIEKCITVVRLNNLAFELFLISFLFENKISFLAYKY